MEKTQIEVINNFIEFNKSNEFISTIQKDFNSLKEITNEIRSLKLKPSSEGEKEINQKKNRYRDILPYDESRVRLNLVKSDESNYESGSDYINASFITNVLDGYYKYIAAQGPTKDTIVDFIRMLVQFNVKIVVCACNEYEGQKLKCHRYWTDDQNEAFCIYKNYYVTLKSKPIVLDDCIIRQIKVIYNPSFMTEDLNSKSASNLENSNRSILEYEFTQFHLINWPDHGVPNNIESIINILGLVRKKMIENNKLLNENFNKLNGNQNGKNCKKIHFPLSNDYLVVHCSAGCGRTGTIIAIDQLWAMINETKLNENFSLYEIAKALREQRIAMIQTQSQYLFFARATALLFEKYLKSLSNRVEKYQNNPVKSQITKVTATQGENKSSSDASPSDLNSQTSRKYRIDSNNNLDYNSQNLNKSVAKKSEFIESSILTPPKSPNTRLKSANITKSPLTTVKQKINRLVPNMFQIFSPNSTPTITNYTQNYASNVHTPISLSSVSSSPSPLSVSSSSSASSSASNAKNSATKVMTRSNLAESYDQSPSLYIKHKSQSKISTPTSTISYNNKSSETTNFSSKSLFVYSELNSERSGATRARSATRLNSNGTPILASPKLARKLSSTSERSSECDLSQQNSDNTELYLNDKSMSKKEPGSGCEFLTHKLNSNRQLQIDLHSNNNIPKSAINYHSEDAVPFSDGSSSMLNFKHVINSAKVSSGKEIDLRQLSQPMKAELYDSLPPKKRDDQENKHLEQSSETPKPPVRTKIQHKRFNMNENTRNAIYNMIESDFGNDSSQNSKVEPVASQLPNKYVEIRVNKSSKSGGNLESYSDNFGTRNYRNGILLDINSNSHKDFDLKENLQDQNKPAQSFYRFKSSKYDILTLPNKKYNHSDKSENKKSEDQDLGPFPFNSNMVQSAKTKLRQSSNYTFNKDLSINVQYVPNKNHYYYLINNLKNPLSNKFNNRKSLKLDQITNDYYENNFSASNENYGDNRCSVSKRRSTQVFDL